MSAQIYDFKTGKRLSADTAEDASLEQRAAHIDSYLAIVRDALIAIEMSEPGQFMPHRPIVIVPHANGRTSITFEPCGIEPEMFRGALKYACEKFQVEPPATLCDDPTHHAYGWEDDE